MLIDKLGVSKGSEGDLSEDSDEERDTKYNILDAEDGGIEEEDECAECDECCSGHHNHGNEDSSGEELPLIRDMDKLQLRTLQENDSLFNEVCNWDVPSGNQNGTK
jgi:hypothetical protein